MTNHRYVPPHPESRFRPAEFLTRALGAANVRDDIQLLVDYLSYVAV